MFLTRRASIGSDWHLHDKCSRVKGVARLDAGSGSPSRVTGTDKGMDAGTERGTDTAEGGTWLTYGELAEIRDIDRHSAAKLVTRHRWRRQKDNRGVLRILVPPEWAVSRDKGTDQGTGTDMPKLQAAITSLQAAFEVALTAKDGEIAAVRETLTAERGWADRAVAAMAGLNGHLVDHSAKLADNQALLVAAQIAQGEAEADAAEVRQADAERRARNFLARLRAAWRGGMVVSCQVPRFRRDKRDLLRRIQSRHARRVP